MKVLQWNIWYKENIENVLKTLKEIDADVVCLQELTIGHECNQGLDSVKYLADGLGFNYFYKEAQGFYSSNGTVSFGNGIFSRYPIVKSSFQYVQEPQDQETEDYSKEGRVYVELGIKVGDLEYEIGTVHMSYTHELASSYAKEKEADKLVEAIKNKKQNFILCGDFNALQGSYCINRVSEHLVSAGPDLKQNTWTTKPFSYQGFEADTLDYRVDYVFCSADVKVKHAKVINTEYSDHLPILIEI